MGQVISAIKRFATWMVSIEFWVVAIFVAGTFVTARLFPVALIVAGLFWIFRWIACGYPSIRTPVDWSIGVLGLMIPITLWATSLPEKTIPQVFRLLTGIAIFYALVNWAVKPMRIRWIVIGITLASIFLALFAMVSVEWSISKFPFIPESLYEQFLLLVSDTANPNVMAGTLTLLFPIVTSVFLFNWHELNRSLRIVVLSAVLMTIFVIILTQSRGAWMAVGVAMIVLFLLRWQRGWLVLILFGAVIAGITQYFGSSFILETLLSSATIGGIDGRQEVWSRAIYMTQDFPITGIGMGTYGDVADFLYPFFLFPPDKVVHAHNLFLQIGVDLGIPGLITWLATFFIVCFVSWNIYRKRNNLYFHDLWIVGLGAGLISSQTALAVHGLTDAVTWGMVRPAPLVWIIWGLAVATWIVVNSPPNSSQKEP